MNVCIVVFEILYNIQSLYVGLDVSETSGGVGTLSKGSGLRALVRFGNVVGARM